MNQEYKLSSNKAINPGNLLIYIITNNIENYLLLCKYLYIYI